MELDTNNKIQENIAEKTNVEYWKSNDTVLQGSVADPYASLNL